MKSGGSAARGSPASTIETFQSGRFHRSFAEETISSGRSTRRVFREKSTRSLTFARARCDRIVRARARAYRFERQFSDSVKGSRESTSFSRSRGYRSRTRTMDTVTFLARTIAIAYPRKSGLVPRINRRNHGRFAHRVIILETEPEKLWSFANPINRSARLSRFTRSERGARNRNRKAPGSKAIATILREAGSCLGQEPWNSEQSTELGNSVVDFHRCLEADALAVARNSPLTRILNNLPAVSRYYRDSCVIAFVSFSLFATGEQRNAKNLARIVPGVFRSNPFRDSSFATERKR